jgi:hypothetical protein
MSGTHNSGKDSTMEGVKIDQRLSEVTVEGRMIRRHTEDSLSCETLVE